MRRIDRLISFVMWGIIGMSVPVMAMLAQDRAFRSDWSYTVALCSVSATLWGVKNGEDCKEISERAIR